MFDHLFKRRAITFLNNYFALHQQAQMCRFLSAPIAREKFRKQIYCNSKHQKQICISCSTFSKLNPVLSVYSKTASLVTWKGNNFISPSCKSYHKLTAPICYWHPQCKGGKINWQISPLIIINIPMHTQICSSHCTNFHFMHNSPSAPNHPCSPSLCSLPARGCLWSKFGLSRSLVHSHFHMEALNTLMEGCCCRAHFYPVSTFPSEPGEHMVNIPHWSFLQQGGPPTLNISFSPSPSITLGLEMLEISYTGVATTGMLAKQRFFFF